MAKKKDRINYTFKQYTDKIITPTYGKGSLLSINPKEWNIKAFPTNLFNLDHEVLGGGLIEGGMVIVHGIEGVSKTGFALHMIRQGQKVNYPGLYVDVENALEPDRFSLHYIDEDNVGFSQPANSEEAIDITMKFINDNMAKVIVFDSIAKLVGKDTYKDNDFGAKMHGGDRAKIVNDWMRKISPLIRQKEIIFIGINQEYINITPPLGFEGKERKYWPEETQFILPAGKQQLYTAWTQLRLKNSRMLSAHKYQKDVTFTTSAQADTNYKEKIAMKVIYKTMKCRLTHKYKECTMPILFNGGYDTIACFLDALIKREVAILKNGEWEILGFDKTIPKKEFYPMLKADRGLRQDLRKQYFIKKVSDEEIAKLKNNFLQNDEDIF